MKHWSTSFTVFWDFKDQTIDRSIQRITDRLINNWDQFDFRMESSDLLQTKYLSKASFRCKFWLKPPRTDLLLNSDNKKTKAALLKPSCAARWEKKAALFPQELCAVCKTALLCCLHTERPGGGLIHKPAGMHILSQISFYQQNIRETFRSCESCRM